MLIRLVAPIAGRRNHYRVKGVSLDLGKEAREVPDDVARRAMDDNPGCFEAVQARGSVDARELKRG